MGIYFTEAKQLKIVVVVNFVVQLLKNVISNVHYTESGNHMHMNSSCLSRILRRGAIWLAVTVRQCC